MMKKLIALVICAVMVLSMIPVVTLTASAAVEGDWDTSRSPKDVDNEEDYTPAPGYRYTSEGFQTISPDYTGITPWMAIRRKDADNLQEGLHLEFRVDEFAYKGETGERDEWISIALWDRQMMAPGDLNYGAGWLCLIRGFGEGAAAVQSFWTTPNDEEGKGGDFAGGYTGQVDTNPQVDDTGCELYTFDVTYSGGAYEIQVNGVTIAGMSTINDRMNELSATGDFWVSIIAQTAEASTPLSMTILDFNGSKPTGDDSKEPEENVNVIAPIADPSTIPANEPCFLWDASATCHSGKINGNMPVAAQGDNSYHCMPTQGDGVYIESKIKGSVSYSADDFPVVAMLLRNYWGGGGQFWYSAGDVMSAQDSCVAPWSLYDDSTCYFGEDDEYVLVMTDLTDMWHDRINAVRLAFGGLDVSDPEFGEFDLVWFGCFRSVEEAQAYAANSLGAQGVVTNPPEETTEEPTQGEDTQAPAPVESETKVDETKAPDVTSGEKDTVVTDAQTTTAPADDAKGCSSVIGGAAVVLLAAAAAGVALKKRH